MNKLSLLLALVVCTLQLSFAQIKKTYKDKVFGQTTVVVKEDSIKDTDILNEFDLDEIGMDQIIQISTQAEKPIPNNIAEQAITTAEATVAVVPVANNPAPEKPKAIALQQRTVDAPGQVLAKEESAPVRTRRAAPGTYRRFSKYPKPKNRRFKKKKRKKYRSSKKLKCFKF